MTFFFNFIIACSRRKFIQKFQISIILSAAFPRDAAAFFPPKEQQKSRTADPAARLF